MMLNLQHYSLLADLFRYPDEKFCVRVKSVQKWLEANYPEAAKELEVFCQTLSLSSLDETQSLFTRTFDVQAITTLDIAYVLFGDDYKRGEVLSHLNREHQRAQNDCGVELGDHLPNLLCLISILEDEEIIQELVHILLAPAIQKMLAEFNPERMDEKNKLYKKHYKTLIETPGKDPLAYHHALKTLFCVLQKDFDVKEENMKNEVENDFLRSVSAEMDIEKVAKE